MKKYTLQRGRNDFIYVHLNIHSLNVIKHNIYLYAKAKLLHTFIYML